MIGGEGDQGPPSVAGNGGEFLLQLLQGPPGQTTTPPSPAAATAARASAAAPVSQPSQILSHDPAVAAVGPTFSFPTYPFNGYDLPYPQHPPPWIPFAPQNIFFPGFPQNPNPNPCHSWSPSTTPQSGFTHNYQHNLHFNSQLGFLGSSPRPESVHQHGRNLMFGSLPCEIQTNGALPTGNSLNTQASIAKIDGSLSKAGGMADGSRQLNGLEGNFQNSPNYSRSQQQNSRAFQNQEQEVRSGGRGWGGRGRGRGRGRQQQQQHQSANFKLTRPPPEVRRYPPGFLSTPSSTGNRSFERNVDKEKRNFVELRDTRFASNIEDKRDSRLSTESRKNFGDMMAERKLSSQLDCPGPPTGSNLPSVSASDVEESMSELNDEIGENGGKTRYRLQADVSRVSSTVRSEFDDSHEVLINALVLEDQPNKKKDQKSSRYKEHRLDTRGQRLLGQRMRIFYRQIECRRDIDWLNAPFLAIYESLIPPEEEKAKQKQLLTLLEKLVWTEWPEARLYIYGSCANSFGVSKSDIDICLTIEDPDVNKSEVLLKLADILESDNLQNVQALTRARVPIVKLKDPVTGISCDICVNNILAVVNTKLLSDYAQIDERLRQLAFIVKHWAKSRGVNETYHGTLSSYAYVLMCIHLLQQRKPAILPCLQQAGKRLD
ncbi:UTP:RNA uridylyltransferase 1 isoform X2 [Diospyros lotus]|uniref:UTP:RNA uridylyltransferase 1 isoform X2 n=1 Tax=Diospyros lotus TaxID=55363 RepID=UPI0022588AD4|nr:UTP:RNA uridylyltransferase 1 isoform X2 [Diospyros lotus]